MKEKDKKKEKEEYALVATLGSDSQETDEEKIDETALMTIGESDIEEEDSTTEVSVPELKNKLHLFSKEKLISLMSALVNEFQEVTSKKDELFNSLTSLKFDLIDMKTCKNTVAKENNTLMEQVSQLGSSNLILKSEILKLTLSEKRKRMKNVEQEKIEVEFTRVKQECNDEKNKVEKLSQEISKLKLDLEKATRWTNFSRIVHQLGEKTHNKKVGLGFHKIHSITKDLCYICGNHDHTTTECPIAAKRRSRSTMLAMKFD